jgi:hypothetical protein
MTVGVHVRTADPLAPEAGYYRIPNYDIYAGNPLSACYEKRLA